LAPDYLTDPQVSALAWTAQTAWLVLLWDVRLKPGDTAVLQDAGRFRSSGFNLPKPPAIGNRYLVVRRQAGAREDAGRGCFVAEPLAIVG
jgi:hypothetical protein